MELEGVVLLVQETTVVSEKFKKRGVVIETSEQYPQTIIVEFQQDKVGLLDGINPQDIVKIGINIRGRAWTSPQGEVKYFNTITGWKINVTDAANATGKPESLSSVAGNQGIPAESDDPDLPF